MGCDMSLATELTTLNSTKAAIKQALLDKNVDLTGVNFAGYASKLNALTCFQGTGDTSIDEKTVLSLATSGVPGGQNNTFIDDTGKTITLYGNVTQGSFSPDSKEAGKWSNYFDGSTGYLSVPDSSVFNLVGSAFTINVSVMRLSDKSKYAEWIVGKRNTGSPYHWAWGLSINDAGSVVFRNNSGNAVTSAVVPLNTFVNISLSVSSSGYAELNVNGTITTGTVVVTDTSAPVTIGNYPVDSPYFHGYISNLKITKAGVTVLDTCKDNRFKDNSAYNHTITPYGNVAVSSFSPYANSVGYVNSKGSAYFDGSGDKLNIAAGPVIGTSSAEISFYIMPVAVTGFNRVLVTTDGAFGAGTFAARYSSANSPVLDVFGSNVTTPFGVWTKVTWVGINGTSQQVKINDVVIHDKTSASYNLTEPFTVIGGSSVYNEYFNGYISNLLITKAGTTVLSLPFNDADIYDLAQMNDIETVGNAKVAANGSVEFDGNGDYLALPNQPAFNFGTGDFNVSFSLRLNTITGTQEIIDARGAASGNWRVYMSGDSLMAYMGSAITLATLAVNTDYLVEIKRVSGTMTCKINVTQTYSASNSAALTPSTGLVYVGRIFDSATNYLNGKIKNLKITKGA